MTISPQSMTHEEINQFFQCLSDINPNPKTELEYTNSFTLLVAVVLSAQATDSGVNKATASLFKVADTPEKILALGEDKVRDYIKTINFNNNKAKNIIRLSESLIKNFNSQVPDSRVDLESLPGVGRKTANVILNVAFHQPTMAVDTHIFRIANRTGMAIGATPLDVENGLLKNIPQQWSIHAHHWLILHGRYICKARKPLCPSCPVQNLCHYPDKNI